MTLLDFVNERPDEIALDDLTNTRTWAELYDRATRIGHLLRDEFGLAAGDYAAMVVGNRVEFIELITAALLSGTWMTPVNWHLTADELSFILKDSGARVLFVDPAYESVARVAASRIGVSVPIVLIGADLDERLTNCSTEPFAPDAPAGGNMFYTSGTTGRPKGVKRVVQTTVADQLAAVATAGQALGLDGGGPHLVTAPLYHAAPVGFAIMDLHCGAPMVIMPRWDPGLALDLITDRGVRNTHLVPTMFVRLLRLLPTDSSRPLTFDGSSLHTVLHGAAPIAPSTKAQMIQWWGPVLVEYWGASEGGVVTLVGSADWLAHPGTVGRAIRTHEVFAADDDGVPLPPDEVGTLWCRNKTSDAVFAYHNDAAKTAAAFRAPGTYTIGDIGRVDAEGYVYLADRAANMIISGGVNIYPAEIEQVLIDHPAVADVAVFGIPDDEWGEQVKAAIELSEGHVASAGLVAELQAFARQRLAAYKVPRSFDFEDELPRHPTGKLYTRLLKEKYWADH